MSASSGENPYKQLLIGLVFLGFTLIYVLTQDDLSEKTRLGIPYWTLLLLMFLLASAVVLKSGYRIYQRRKSSS